MFESQTGSQAHCAEDLSGGQGLPADEHRKSQTTVSEVCDRWKGERGSVTVMTAVLLVGLVLVLGLSIDVSRIYMVRSGLQNAADAAALAAARELNSGPGGINDAVNQTKVAALEANKYGLNRTGVTAPAVTISKVEFAAFIDGTWYNAGDASALGVVDTIKFVRVTTQAASVSVLLAAKALGATHIEQRTAVAGMSVGLNTICNVFPVVIALTPKNQTDLLVNGKQFTVTYQDDITGSSAAVVDHSYAVIQVDSFFGHVGTVQLAAGIPNLCAYLGQTETLDSSQSANKKNGRNAISDGANTRFDFYPTGGGGIDPITFPPDTNIM